MEKDMLFHGLPGVFHRDKYIVFSPYKKQIITLSKDETKNKEIYEKLNKQGFFGKPKTNEDDENSVKITLFLTSACSMKCIYCFNSSGEKSKEAFMSEELALKVLKQKLEEKPKATYYIHFFGGEPSLNFSVIKAVVEFLKSKKVKSFYRINLNGIIQEDKLKYMLDNGFHFDVSCDGTPKLQNKQRPLKSGGDSSILVEKTIKFLVKNNADFKVKAVITNLNYRKMPEIVDYLADLGVKNIRLELVLIFGRARKNKIKEPDKKQFVKYLFKALDKAKQRKVYISNWAYRNLLDPLTYFCQAVKSKWLIIFPDRRITKCINQFIYLGKVNQDGSLDINKKKLQQALDYSVEKMPKCKDCFAKYICSGGCYYENYLLTGNALEPPPEKCKLTKEILRKLIIKIYENNHENSI